LSIVKTVIGRVYSISEAPTTRVVDPYSFFTDPDPELDVGGQYGSGSGSNTDPGL
jgi:hypothetical protein